MLLLLVHNTNDMFKQTYPKRKHTLGSTDKRSPKQNNDVPGEKFESFGTCLLK